MRALLALLCALATGCTLEVDERNDCTVTHGDGDSMSKPDWARRIGVESRAYSGTGARFTPLGDPTRWGAEYVAVLPPNPLVEVNSGQIIRVQCSDLYSRAWMMTGTVQASTLAWGSPAANWQATLDVTFGVGQGVVRQSFDLRALTTIALASTAYVAQVDGNTETRPWVISGGLFANQIGASVRNRLVGFDEANPQTIRVALALAPFNAGTGL